MATRGDDQSVRMESMIETSVKALFSMMEY